MKLNLKKDKATLAQFIKCKEASEILGVTRNTAKQWVIDGKLDCQHISSGKDKKPDMLFYKAQVQAYVDNQ